MGEPFGGVNFKVVCPFGTCFGLGGIFGFNLACGLLDVDLSLIGGYSIEYQCDLAMLCWVWESFVLQLTVSPEDALYILLSQHRSLG